MFTRVKKTIGTTCAQQLRAYSSDMSKNVSVQQFYQNYVAAFTSGDMKTVSVEYYKAPLSVSMCVNSNTVMRSTFNTTLDIEQALTFQMEGLLARGYSGKSDMDPVTITPMTDIAKLIQTKGTRYHQSGEILERIKVSYVIERIGEGVETDEPEVEKWFITSIHGEIIPVME